MKYIDRFLSSLLLLFLITILYYANSEASAKHLRNKHKHKLWKALQKRQKVTNVHHAYEKPSRESNSLARRFETIRDLGSIVRCRLHSDETTVIAGNNLICGGKRYAITPEAAKDAEEGASTRQGIALSPDGNPQDLQTTLNSGIYGKPIMSFLGESSQPATSSKFLEPHDKYPILGIFDRGMRNPDPGLFERSMAYPMSLDRSNRFEDSFDDFTAGTTRDLGSTGLGDINQAVDGGYDKVGNADDFYRDEQMQSKAFEMDGTQGRPNNPFGQYWKSLKSGFYQTTPSQLGEDDPVANGNPQFSETGEVKTKIPKRKKNKLSTKKSSIQPKVAASSSTARRAIPRPNDAGGVKITIGNKNVDPNHKRYFIFGKRNQPFPVGMFAGVPSFGPWQYQMNHYQRGREMPMARSPIPFNPRPQMPMARSPIPFNPREQMPMARSPIPFNPREQMLTGRSPMPYNQEQQMPMARSPIPSRFWNRASAPQRGVARSFGSNEEWGTRSTPRFYDPLLAGNPTRVPMDPIYAQMRANEDSGEPGRPLKGRFQYGIQPGNGPPFLGYASIPIMQPVPMSDGRGDPEMMQREEEGADSQGALPSNFNMNNRDPGIVQGTEEEAAGSRGSVRMPMGNGELNYDTRGSDETLARESFADSSYTSGRTVGPQEDATMDFEKITGPENYLPAPFYKSPMYNPHESEDYFPDGANQKLKQAENEYLQKNGYANPAGSYKENVYTGPSGPHQENVKSAEGNAAELYEDDVQQEQQDEEEEARKRGNLAGTHIDIHGNKLDSTPDGKFMFTKEHVGFGPITVEAKTAKSEMKDPSDDDR